MPKCKNGKCLIEGCPSGKIYARGLCPLHYRIARESVRDKIRTWEELEKYRMANLSLRNETGEQRKRFDKMWAKKSKKVV